MFHHPIIPKEVSIAQKVGIFQVGGAEEDWLSTVLSGELAFKRGGKSVRPESNCLFFPPSKLSDSTEIAQKSPSI